MSLNKGLSVASQLFKRPAGCLSASLFKGHSERAKDEGRKTKNEERRTKDERLFRSDVVANRIS